MPFSPTPLKFFVAGVKYYEGYKVFAKEVPNLPIPVPLIGEPSNKYDRYAVRIEYASPGGERTQLGHVPKPHNLDIWAAKDAGYKPLAHIVVYNPLAYTQIFQVEVTFTKIT